MLFSQALRVPDRAVIALVGGGGKTSALYRLAVEISEPGVGRVLLMTTAKMLLPQHHDADGLFIHADFNQIAQRLETTIPYLRRIAIAPDVMESADGWKMDSVPLDWPGRLAGLTRVAGVIVEADGSRHLPFKAPSVYEPPIPPDATMVIVVVGLDVLGQPLDEAHVHRPERVSALTGAALGATVDGDMITKVLAHPEGGLKNVPPGAQRVALLNKVSEDNLGAARDIAQRVLTTNTFDAVLLGAIQSDDPIRERHVRVGAVVLAAGGASRFGGAKQALPWQGTTLVGHAVGLAQAHAQETVVVTGGHAAEVRAAVQTLTPTLSQREREPVNRSPSPSPTQGGEPDSRMSSPPSLVGKGDGGLGLTIVHNDAWQEGLSGSVRVGLGALSERVGAALFLLADQPAVTPEIVQAIVQRYVETGAPIVVPTFGGKRGNPTLFDRALWPELAQVTGDQGGRVLIEKYRDQVQFIEVGEAAALDVDTPEDYKRLTQ